MVNDPSVFWEQVLGELRFQMPRVTFDAWLEGTVCREVGAGRVVILVANGYAKEWIDNRLNVVISRVVSALAGEPLRLETVVKSSSMPVQASLFDEALGGGDSGNGVSASFAGFEIPKSNYVQVPHIFIDQVLPFVRPTVSMLVMVTLRQTFGVLLSAYERKREWITTHTLTRQACNFGRAAMYTALWESRASGLLIYRQILEPERRDVLRAERIAVTRFDEVVYGLRPRWVGDPVDFPEEDKPRR